MKGPDWANVRAAFALDSELLDFASLSITSHPKPVRQRIQKYRHALDRRPLLAGHETFGKAEEAVAVAAGKYFGIPAPLVAVTGSTTMGLAQIHGGVRVRPGDEILTSRQEHFTTVETLQLRRRRDGTRIREVSLYTNSADVGEDEILENLRAEIRPQTRVLALTWVYSSTGLKLPIAGIADLVREENAARAVGADPLLLCVDGVHGFGVEDVGFDELRCDLFVAGCHKWIFGPRGTGIVCGTPDAWRHVVPLMPTFSDAAVGPGRLHTPGGIHAYEHAWALEAAFEFLLAIGKPTIEARVRELADRLKDGLRAIHGVDLRTPRSSAFSSGIVCFDIAGLAPSEAVERLRAKQIVATESSWDRTAARTHVRLSVSIRNHESELDQVLAAIEDLAGH